MQCMHPSVIKNPEYAHGKSASPYAQDKHMEVPCGHCPACAHNRSRDWQIRLQHESQSYLNMVFVTLTYDDKIKKVDVLDKRDVQLFIKRLRFNCGKKIRYFVGGEYGAKYGRPHYHAIIFGLSKNDSEIIRRSWANGFITVKGVHSGVLRYITKYTYKSVVGGQEYPEGIQAPFSLKSIGLGKEWCLRNRKDLTNPLYFGRVLYNKVLVKAPRYYHKLLEITKEYRDVVYQHAIQRVVKLAETGGRYIRQAMLDIRTLSFSRALDFARRMQARELDVITDIF